MLRVKIGLERINMQEGVTVEVLLDSGVIGLVMSSEFARKQGFKLKKIERPIYIRNVNKTLNKEELIENTMEVNIYYQGYRKRTEINVIGGQRWNVILEIPQLAYYNPEIDQRTEEVKMTRCLKECGKQQRPKQKKLEWQKQKEEEKKEEEGKKRNEKKKEKKREKQLKKMKVQNIAEEWKIWDEEEGVAKSEVEAKKLVPGKFLQQIHVFGKKASEQMPTKKL